MSYTMKISTGACRYADPFPSECRASSNIHTMPKSTGKASGTPLRFFDSATQPWFFEVHDTCNLFVLAFPRARARAQQRGARARPRRQECTRQRFRDTIDREHGRIGIPSLLPHFDHEHEHRFTEHEHDKCV